MDNDTVRTINDIAGTQIPLNEKGDVVNMCKAWEEQYEDGVSEGLARGNVRAIKKMISRFTKEEILQDYTEKEYNTALKELQQEQNIPCNHA